MSSRTMFKFSKPPDGLTRRVMFYNRPPWSELAAKIEDLFAISRDHVGVSYLDNEGDEVTLSSEEELQDYYRLNYNEPVGDAPPKAIRFTIVDLNAPRSPASQKSLPRTPQSESNPNRNTFGGTQGFPFVFEVADDWQRVPSMGPMGGADLFMSVGRDTDSPHAFVEVLDSDASMSKDAEEKEDSHSDTVTQSDVGAGRYNKNKGKARAETIPDEDDDDRSSTLSLLAGEEPVKSAVHIQQKSRSSTPRGHTPGSAVVSRRSTPKPTLDTDANSTQYPDPPLPDLGSASNSTPNASLTNDVANLFNALSSAFAAHPELSEGLRNIVQHATNGAYWNAHRRAVSQAADEVRRAALDGSREIQRATEEVHRATEEAAGRRVTEAIGNVVRVITDLTAPTGAAVPEEPVTSTPVREQAASGETPRRRTGSPSRRQTWGGWFGPHPPPHFGPHRHGPFPPRPPFDLYGAPLPPHIRPPHFGPGHHGHGHRGPVPPPPPPPAGPIPSPPPFPPPPGPPPFGPPGMGHHRPPPPPPPPPHGGPGHSRHGSLRRRPHQDWFGSSWGVEQFGGRPVDIMDITGDVGDMSLFGGAANLTRSASVEQEHAMTRARLEAAKEAYKREKDRYKKERDDLRKEREKRSISMEEKTPNPEPAPELRATSSVPVAGPSGSRSRSRPRTPPSVSQIVSNARGPYPQLEMFSVPRRSNTIQGTGRERSIPRQNPLAGPSQIYSPFTPTPAARTSENVKRRLADMGFTRDVYPNIPDKVAKRVSQSVVSQSFMSQKDVEEISKDKEDTIVSDVLEELLQEPPPPLPAKDRPTGSGAKPDDDDLLF